MPAADFVVDDARRAREEGADFAADVPEDAKSGTRHNMLSAALLDAERFPLITSERRRRQAAGRRGSGDLVATVTISVAGHESTLVVPFTLDDLDPSQLSATRIVRCCASRTWASRRSA